MRYCPIIRKTLDVLAVSYMHSSKLGEDRGSVRKVAMRLINDVSGRDEILREGYKKYFEMAVGYDKSA